MDEPLMIDARVASGMEKQIERMQLDLGCGAKRVGWKIGLNAKAIQRRLEIPSSVVGYLTDSTVLPTGCLARPSEPIFRSLETATS